MKVIWLFGEDSVGKKTLINKMSLYSTTFEGNLELRKLFNMNKDSILIPLVIDKFNKERKENIISNLYTLNKFDDFVLMVHGQWYDIKTLESFSKIDNFYDFNFCYYLLPNEKDYKIRRTSRKKKYSTNYSDAINQKNKNIKQLQKIFKDIKIINI